ncbi:hypothetical protein HWV62_42303 [Athelia sp. TMB]|nr:hypothetical protein HWV62_42303 [Athelia sp. TMB]
MPAAQTRSGRAFNPWMIGVEALSAAPTADFNFGKLLQAAICRECASPVVDARPIDDAASFPAGDASHGACGGAFDQAADSAFEIAPRDTFEQVYGRPCEYDPEEDEGGSAYAAGSCLSSSALSRAPSPAPPHFAFPQHAAEPSAAASSLAATAPAPSAPSVKAWKAARNKRCGKEREARRREARTLGACAETRAFLSRHLLAHEPLAVDLTAAEMPHATAAYQGVRDSGVAKRLWTAEECVRIWGHVVKKWDGKRWDDAHRAAAALIQDAGHECSFTAVATFQLSLRESPSAGGKSSYADARRQQPGNLVHSEANDHALSKLLESRAIRRLAGFASTTGALAFWCPQLHHYYRNTLGPLFRRYPLLKQNFKNSVFPCTTVNFGPRTCCFPHTDANNLPYGLCAITALGSFDSTLGGRLILWDLKLVIEFPPGATILIPSTTIRHSNTPIQEGKTRYSFTQYAAGGLFRWVEHGFRTERARTAGWSQAQVEEDRANGVRRWEDGINLFSTLEELRNAHSRR